MNTSKGMVRVWDPLVRIGHWTLVATFFIAYFTEDDFLTVHVWAGYVAGVVVCLRVLWGFVGSPHARFADFVRSPAVVWGYLRDIFGGHARRYLGHNPAGGAMILALLIGVAGTVGSGLVLYAVEDNAGPLAGLVSQSPQAVPAARKGESVELREYEESGDEEEFWEEVHEIFTNLTLLLVALHVAGVLLASYSHRENLVKAMLTGEKHSES
jgi:cytochrome b